MAFTAQDVKDLRERTGVGMMDCKKALTEANGDIEKAVEMLGESSLAAATKKANRIASEGMVFALSDKDKNVGALVEINSETDFVAKNEGFQEFVKAVVQVVIDNNPADVDALLACAFGKETVADALRDKILVIGENLKIRRFVRYEGLTIPYVHGGGTHAALVSFETSKEVAAKPEFVEFGRDVAMQIAAANPLYLNRSDVPEEVLDEERALLKQQAIDEGKPEAIAEKMVAGRVNKYYETNCLLDQKFIKDPELSVTQFIQKVGKELGGDIKVVAFTRFEKGEGLEKRSDDFAAEVAGMI